MITVDNFEKLLESLDYSKENDSLFFKQFNRNLIKVDFKNEKIIYPKDLAVHDNTTSNFSHPENFVVFECVNRLLSKGYLAKNLELEPKWPLGRGASGGKADILVKDNNGDEFLIIECKTHGKEYDKAWKKTEKDGDQLFSYAQQVRKTQYLCLYSSNFEDGEVSYFNKIIALKDNEEYLKKLNPEDRITYKEASDVKELFNVWKEIYNLESEERGIFEEGISPYEINKVNSLDSLKVISFEDSKKKYHDFATILRQHNISSHENAFDKLVNIFLAKIVDEDPNKDNLEFYWRGTAYDDYYQLHERLQKLYKVGMKDFLNEEVTYIDDGQLNDAFMLFQNDPDETKDTVMSYFRKLKFYTNNDFAFIDVHNEKLFKENSEILLKVVRMFQDIKLKTENQNQFLGDLFEGFLDDGVKQSEGQFFTPLPITRFIISSLPLKNIISDLDEPPKVIDYACGAGHFLNEYANQIRRYLTDGQISKYYSEIYGIEKEYRLSKVSKVSAFMYGQDEIKIIYGDALGRNNDIKDNYYDILIANPPYSVKGFLDTLTEEEREKYELFSIIKNNYMFNNSIETFFVERAKQLIKDDGVAGIILPSSMLTNGSNIYVKTREIILSNFDIISIVELPSGTFGATGTNTIVLFLRKRKTKPSLGEHYKNRVESWFRGEIGGFKDEIFDDGNLLVDYLVKQNIDYEDYKEFLSGTINDNLKNTFVFKQYFNENKEEKDIIELEKDKLLYFLLSNSQENNVVVVNAPTKSKEKKEFLGYDWSRRKGYEGIKYVGAARDDDSLSKNRGIDNIRTPLFNPKDLNDNEKINTIIRNNFNNIEMDIVYDNVNYLKLTDMIDFSRPNFDKSINLGINQTIELKSKYPVDFLGNVCDIRIGGTPPRSNPSYFSGDNLWVSIKEMDGQEITNTKEKITDEAIIDSNVKLIPKGTTLLSFKLSIGKTAIAGKDLYTNEAIASLIPKDKGILLDKYLFYLFNTNILDSSSVGNKAFGKSLNSSYLKNYVQIPVPPIDIQKDIINKCEKIDSEYNNSRIIMNNYKEQLKEYLIKFKVYPLKSLDEVLIDTGNIKNISTKVPINNILSEGEVPVISQNNSSLIDGFTNNYEPISELPLIIFGDHNCCFKYVDFEFVRGGDGTQILLTNENEVKLKYLYYISSILDIENSDRYERHFKYLKNVKIPIPPISVQEDIIKECSKFENKINELQNTLNELNQEKADIVNNILEIKYNKIS